MATHIRILRLQISKVCYIIKLVQGIIGLGIIRIFYHSKFESLVRHGIIVWGANNESVPIFKLQKMVIQSVCGAGTGTSCRQLTLSDIMICLASVVCVTKTISKQRLFSFNAAFISNM